VSKELAPIENPGLPEHAPRKTDIDPKAEKRAEKQVASLFALSAISTIGFVYSYVWVKPDVHTFIPLLGDMNVQQLLLGICLSGAFLFIGIGAIAWARFLMPDHEVIAHRHEFRSSDEDRKEFVETVKVQGAAAGIGRRPLIKRTLGAALGLVGIAPIMMLRDLGPLPKKAVRNNILESGNTFSY